MIFEMHRPLSENITVGVAAEILGVSNTAIHGMLKRGEIPGAKRIGSWWRIPRAEVERILREGPRQPTLEREEAHA